MRLGFPFELSAQHVIFHSTLECIRFLAWLPQNIDIDHWLKAQLTIGICHRVKSFFSQLFFVACFLQFTCSMGLIMFFFFQSTLLSIQFIYCWELEEIKFIFVPNWKCIQLERLKYKFLIDVKVMYCMYLFISLFFSSHFVVFSLFFFRFFVSFLSLCVYLLLARCSFGCFECFFIFWPGKFVLIKFMLKKANCTEDN